MLDQQAGELNRIMTAAGQRTAGRREDRCICWIRARSSPRATDGHRIADFERREVLAYFERPAISFPRFSDEVLQRRRPHGWTAVKPNMGICGELWACPAKDRSGLPRQGVMRQYLLKDRNLPEFRGRRGDLVNQQVSTHGVPDDVLVVSGIPGDDRCMSPVLDAISDRRFDRVAMVYVKGDDLRAVLFVNHTLTGEFLRLYLRAIG